MIRSTQGMVATSGVMLEAAFKEVGAFTLNNRNRTTDPDLLPARPRTIHCIQQIHSISYESQTILQHHQQTLPLKMYLGETHHLYSRLRLLETDLRMVDRVGAANQPHINQPITTLFLLET